MIPRKSIISKFDETGGNVTKLSKVSHKNKTTSPQNLADLDESSFLDDF